MSQSPENSRLTRLRRQIADAYRAALGKVSQRLSRLVMPCPGCTALRRWFGASPRDSGSQPGAHRLAVAAASQDLVRYFARRDYARSRRRRYALHLPPQYGRSQELPLVMVLHGCRQDEQDIRQISGFDAIADQEGFVVVYPFVTSYAGLRTRNCWGWWQRHEIEAGAGEVEDLWQIINEVAAKFRIDRRRIHVTGLSSGAAMAAALLVAHADRIASGAVVAGVPYGETARAVNLWGFGGRFKPVDVVADAMQQALRPGAHAVPLMVVHSDADETVNIRAAHNLRDSWGRCFGVDTERPQTRTSGITLGAPWVHSCYGRASQNGLVETLFVEGRGHGWYGGNPGSYSYPEAPDVSRWIWDFFQRQPPLPATTVGSSAAKPSSVAAAV
ncbi:MAG: hypothetical protein C0630_13145 [Sedimenticola selenatireducens]|uniref:Esterase n=1 Tax=Sedimenticola selenatireducens TaxID=191960 RepID=A0A2N6CUZ1_9GAMM|nr:MAG: hypothetical protein C0630_13145 [Sedimenticola selenatireducens]